MAAVRADTAELRYATVTGVMLLMPCHAILLGVKGRTRLGTVCGMVDGASMPEYQPAVVVSL